MKHFDPTFFSRIDKIRPKTGPDANQSSTSWYAAMHPTRWQIHQVLHSFPFLFLYDCYLCRWTRALLTGVLRAIITVESASVKLRKFIRLGVLRLMLCELTDGHQCLSDCTVSQARLVPPAILKNNMSSAVKQNWNTQPADAEWNKTGGFSQWKVKFKIPRNRVESTCRKKRTLRTKCKPAPLAIH